MNLDSAMQSLQDTFGQAQQWLFESLVQPLVFALGMGGWLEQAFDGTGWLLVGLLQLLVMLAVIAPLQRLWPAEPLYDRAAVRTDIVYTLIHRLGLFRVAMFFALQPLLDAAFGALRGAGLPTLHVDALWPGVTDRAWVSFCCTCWRLTLSTTGCTARNTAGAGGGNCMRCTTRKPR